jgi:hypothetical protein
MTVAMAHGNITTRCYSPQPHNLAEILLGSFAHRLAALNTVDHVLGAKLDPRLDVNVEGGRNLRKGLGMGRVRSH